jgi:lysophospholipase L1-like esterase
MNFVCRPLPLIVLSALVLTGCVTRSGPDSLTLPEPLAADSTDDTAAWYDALHIGLEGQAWTDVKAPYDRLPAKAEGVVRKSVWGLSHHSAGLAVRFQTNSKFIRARWKVTSSRLAMPHMPATGVSGLDLYARDGKSWRWVGAGRPGGSVENEANLVTAPGDMREYLLYLPLYNGVESLSVGVAPEATLFPVRPPGGLPIVDYGTSITQGGCASRPGMVHPAILGRRLECEFINLGFSGNGTMDPEMADLLAEIPSAVYVIDCCPNMSPEMIAERTVPFVHRLRQQRAQTPILLVENIEYQNAWFLGRDNNVYRKKNQALREAYEQLEREGVPNLYYLRGEDLLGRDSQATVDGTHPTDLGFIRMADAFEPKLRRILPRSRARWSSK